LTTRHPAHPEAAAAPAGTSSKTLDYTSSDMPSPQPLSGAQSGAQGAAGPVQRTAVSEGKVIATNTDAGQIIVEHGEIEGFMMAMTMGYRVYPPSLVEGIKIGDKVRFTIDIGKLTIVKIEKIP
jgi:Cu/Ag efflux protein CusF